MPKCKYCHENITKFDKEICPFCGGKKPLEGVDDSTYDITQFVDIMKKSDQEVKFKQRKRVTNGLLCMFLGIFGADAFYLGFKKIGFIRLIIDIVIYAAISLILFFFTELSFYSFIIPFGVLFIIYFIIGIINLTIRGKKDINGVFLR